MNENAVYCCITCEGEFEVCTNASWYEWKCMRNSNFAFERSQLHEIEQLVSQFIQILLGKHILGSVSRYIVWRCFTRWIQLQ